MPLSIEDLRRRLANAGKPYALRELSPHQQLVKMAHERGLRYFRLKERDRYAIYDNETSKKISGKKLIPAKEAIELLSAYVRHSELHGDNNPDA
jgi:hypothetical protein